MTKRHTYMVVAWEHQEFQRCRFIILAFVRVKVDALKTQYGKPVQRPPQELSLGALLNVFSEKFKCLGVRRQGPMKTHLN